MSYTDEQIGRVVSLLRRNDLDKNTVIIIVADHGEMLGHRGVYYNHQTLFDGTIHVPFVVYGDGFKSHRAESLASAVDVAPTLMDIAGYPLPLFYEGVSLVPVLNGDELPETKMALAFHAADIATALIRLPYKYIHNKAAYGDPEKYELYDLAHDPLEYHNQAQSNPFVFHLMSELEEEQTGKPEQGIAAIPLSHKEKEKLAALGYTQ